MGLAAGGWAAGGMRGTLRALANIGQASLTRPAPLLRQGAADVYIENACGESPPPLAFGDLWLIRQSGLSQAAFLKSLDDLFGFRVMELKMKHVGLQNPIKNMKASIKMGSKINKKSNKSR